MLASKSEYEHVVVVEKCASFRLHVCGELSRHHFDVNLLKQFKANIYQVILYMLNMVPDFV